MRVEVYYFRFGGILNIGMWTGFLELFLMLEKSYIDEYLG